MLFKKLKALRGAVCCEDSQEAISEAVDSLYSELLNSNKLKEKDIVSIQFTITKDLKAMNPATALRKNGFAKNTPLFCAIEPEIFGAMPKTIRILIYYYGRKPAKHTYLGEAKKLRPDYSNDTSF